MKYQPSKSFIFLMVPLCPSLAALMWGILPEVSAFEKRTVPGEIEFPAELTRVGPTGANPTSQQASTALPGEWLGATLENLMTWKHNPWRQRSQNFGGHYLTLCSSGDPLEVAHSKELQRLAQSWYKRLQERYPELAVKMEPVPDKRNGFLRWLDFSDRFKTGASNYETIGFTKDLEDYLDREGPWDPVAARSWLESRQSVMKELRIIGDMSQQSADGIPVERWAFIPERLVRSCAQALYLEARLEAERGDAEAALETIREAVGLADHFTRVETPGLLGANVRMAVRKEIRSRVISEILPALPAERIDLAAWEDAVVPQVESPRDFARLVKGEWSLSVRASLLPMLLDSNDPKPLPDSGSLLDAHAAPFQHIVRAAESGGTLDFQNLMETCPRDFSHLSARSRTIAGITETGLVPWGKAWQRDQAGSALAKAAFAILSGREIPAEPSSGLPYQWDPASRQLSMPRGTEPGAMDIEPITVPELRVLR